MYKRFVCCCFFLSEIVVAWAKKIRIITEEYILFVVRRLRHCPSSFFSSLLSIGLHSKKTYSVYRTSLYHKFIIRKSNSNILFPCHKQLYDKIIAIRLISHCRLTVTSATESWIQEAALCFAAVVPVDACRTYFDLKWNGFFFVCLFRSCVFFQLHVYVHLNIWCYCTVHY